MLFFNTFENYFAVLEAKKNVRTIGLIHNSFNSFLIFIFLVVFFKHIIKLL